VRSAGRSEDIALSSVYSLANPQSCQRVQAVRADLISRPANSGLGSMWTRTCCHLAAPRHDTGNRSPIVMLIRSLVQCNCISGIRALYRVRQLREGIHSESENGGDAGLKSIVLGCSDSGSALSLWLLSADHPTGVHCREVSGLWGACLESCEVSVALCNPVACLVSRSRPGAFWSSCLGVNAVATRQACGSACARCVQVANR
jgi:hypothetical protein